MIENNHEIALTHAARREYSLNLDRLKELATAFRKAIEQCDKARLPISFETFPRGSCGDTAHLLGTFFREHGMGTFQYICGERGATWAEWHSHAWLHADGVIVDITADQFSEVTEPVIVTTNSAWHSTFDQESLHEADCHLDDARTYARLGDAYRTILEKLIE